MGLGESAYGTVYKMESTGEMTVLHRFTVGADGYSPTGGVILDATGNLYGETFKGGSHGYGTIFKINTNHQYSVLYDFTGEDGGPNGGQVTGLARDAAGNLYGILERWHIQDRYCWQ